MSSLEERVSRLESTLRRMRLASTVKNAIYLVVIVGVAVYLYQLYVTAGQWQVELSDMPKIGLESPTQLKVTVPVKVYNPADRVFARLVYYKVYVEGYYAGDGLIPYLDLPPGWSEHRVSVVIDLDRVGCGLAKALSSKSNVTVEVQGYLMVDLKAFGVVTWKTVTLPFNATAAEVEVPALSEQAASLLSLYTLICDEAPRLVSVLSELASTPAGSLTPGQPSPRHGQGGAAPISVEADVSVTGFMAYTATINITNTAAGPVKIEEVKVNGRMVGADILPVTLQPGETVTLTLETTSPTLLIEVTVNGQTYTYTRTHTG